MRIELKEEQQEETKEKDANDLRNKHESDLTRKEKRELERMKLAEMGVLAKLQYIWTYYKPQIFSVIGAIALFFAGREWYENAKIETVLSMAVIDSYGANQEGIEDSIEEILGITEDPYQVAMVDESMHTDESGALEAYSQMALSTKVAAEAFDILIGSEDYIDNFVNREEYFMDLREFLPEDLYAAFGEQDDPYSLCIDSEELCRDLETTYLPMKISVLVNAQNPENVITWLTAVAENY